MFPRTGHVESVVLLSQQKPDDIIKIDLDLSKVDITVEESKATYSQIADYVKEHYGFNVSSLYISQVKRKNGLEVNDSYNKPKKGNSRVPVCPKEKSEAITEALRFFKMVK